MAIGSTVFFSCFPVNGLKFVIKGQHDKTMLALGLFSNVFSNVFGCKFCYATRNGLLYGLSRRLLRGSLLVITKLLADWLVVDVLGLKLG